MQKSQKHPPNMKLKAERVRRNWTQVQVEVKIGVPPGSLGRWERGDVFQEAYPRMKLCKLYDKTADELGFIEQEAQTLPQLPLTEALVANDEAQENPSPLVSPQSPIYSKSISPR